MERGKLQRGFFPEKNCKTLLLVRGTTSFYSQKVQLLPDGESEMWNVSMRLNE